MKILFSLFLKNIAKVYLFLLKTARQRRTFTNEKITVICESEGLNNVEDFVYNSDIACLLKKEKK